MKKVLFLLVVLGCLMLTSCATLFSDDTADVVINSNPAGAKVTVDGTEMGTTPITLKLSSESSHSITLSKDDYTPQTVVVEKSIKWGWQVVDIFTTGLVGNVVDLLNPNGYTLKPSEFNITLVPSN